MIFLDAVGATIVLERQDDISQCAHYSMTTTTLRLAPPRSRLPALSPPQYYPAATSQGVAFMHNRWALLATTRLFASLLGAY